MLHTSSSFESATPDHFRPDPRLEVRIAVRHALEGVRSGNLKFSELDQALSEFPSLVEAALERERVMDAHSVGALRMALGMEVNPWDTRAEQAIRIFENAVSPADQTRLAAGVLQGETVCLPALALAVCRFPDGLPLLVAMHAVAPHGEPRKELARAISQRRSGVVPPPPLVLNRESPAFHFGFLDQGNLVMAFREMPGHYTIFKVQLMEALLSIHLVPVTGEESLHKALSARSPALSQVLGLGDCRAQLGVALAKLEDREASEAWRSLGHLLEERLFPTEEDGSGFVVGEQSARLLLDRLAQVLVDGDNEALSNLVEPGSHAGVLMELFGPIFFQHVIGIPHGVSRVDASVDLIGERRATALVIGRTEQGSVRTRCEMVLGRLDTEWCIQKVIVQGIGVHEGMFRPVWEILSGEVALPIRAYGGLPEVEQELVVGLMDTGFRIDEVAAAVTMLRELKITGAPGTVAAACHAVYEQLVDTRPVGYSDRRYGNRMVELCEQYDADLTETASLTGKIESLLGRNERFRDYLLPN
jgi:hypothetical protein